MSPIKSKLLTAYNFVSPLTGFQKIYDDEEYYWESSPLNPSNNPSHAHFTVKDLPKTNGFSEFKKTHISGVNQLFAGKKIGDALVTETLKENIGVKKSISDLFKFTRETTAAEKEFNLAMEDITRYLSSNKTANPKNVTDYLFATKDAAVKAIKAQHAAEINQLEACNFSILQTTLHADNQIELDNLKEEALTTLKKSHADTLKAFEDSINDPIKKLLESTFQRKRATLERYKQNDETAEEIAGIIAIGQKRDKKKTDITDEELSQLQTIKTRTGLKLQNMGNNAFSLSLPNRFFSHSYYSDSKNNLKNDIRSIPEAIQRLGFTKITMNASHKNQEEAIKLGRLAYAACRETGFKADDITINVNGKLMKREELFKSNEIAAIDAQAARYDADWKKLAETTTKSADDFKREVRNFRARTADDAADHPTSLSAGQTSMP